MLELIIGQIPEAIYFALFMIYAKGLKEKRILFTVLMVSEYLLLKYSFPYNWFFQIGYMITTFLTLKILYKEKSQIIDIFIFCISYIIIIFFSFINFIFANITFKNMIIANILCKITIFLFIFFYKNKLNKLQNIYKILWNRNDKIKKKIKTTTFRALNIFIFNVLFFIFNLGMIYALYLKEMR